jgi:DNA-binding NarL/FixJ family response regulator
MRIKVAIIEAYPVIAEGLKKILSEDPHMAVTSVYQTGNELLQDTESGPPDVMIMDTNPSGSGEPDLVRRLLKNHPQLKILVFSHADVLFRVKEMFRSGCSGYLLKNADDRTILKAVETVYEGKPFLSSVLQQRLLDDAFLRKKEPGSQMPLSGREKEVLQLIAEEFTNQNIADKLFVSLSTVDNHRSQLLHKLNARNTAGLMKKAIMNGLIEIRD